jgi:hypothetical protein
MKTGVQNTHPGVERFFFCFSPEYQIHLYFRIREIKMGSPEKSGVVACFQVHFPSIFLCLIRPILLFAMTQRGKQKSLGCVRFTRKSYVLPAKITETRRTFSNSSNFLTPSSLVFRLTDRGHRYDVLNVHM